MSTNETITATDPKIQVNTLSTAIQDKMSLKLVKLEDKTPGSVSMKTESVIRSFRGIELKGDIHVLDSKSGKYFYIPGSWKEVNNPFPDLNGVYEKTDKGVRKLTETYSEGKGHARILNGMEAIRDEILKDFGIIEGPEYTDEAKVALEAIEGLKVVLTEEQYEEARTKILAGLSKKKTK